MTGSTGQQGSNRVKIKNLHRWDVTPKEAIEIQRKLQKRILLKNFSKDIHLVAGADAAFSTLDKLCFANVKPKSTLSKTKKIICQGAKKENLVHGAVCVFSFPDMELVEEKTATLPLKFPYIPGLLSFREGTVLLKCFEKIKNAPDVILFDGQGIMHPRKMGIAAHLGILLNKPAIGCAKSYLYGEFNLPANFKGAFEYVRDKNGELIGACLRTRKDVKPIFVSTGHKISLSKAIDIVLACTKRYRLPEPLRYAHRLAEITKQRYEKDY